MVFLMLGFLMVIAMTFPGFLWLMFRGVLLLAVMLRVDGVILALMFVVLVLMLFGVIFVLVGVVLVTLSFLIVLCADGLLVLFYGMALILTVPLFDHFFCLMTFFLVTRF